MITNLIVSLIVLIAPVIASAEFSVNELDGFNIGRSGIRVYNANTGSSLNGGDATLKAPNGSLCRLAIGDLVILNCGCSSTSAATDCFMDPSPPAGLTEIVDITNGDSTSRQSVSYLWVTASNLGTTLTCNGSGGSADATAGTMTCIKNVNFITQIDATSTTSTGNSTNPDPNSITTVTDAAAVWLGCVSTANDSTPGVVSGYPTLPAQGFAQTLANDTGIDVSISSTVKVISKFGAENPGAYSTWSTGQWTCATVAIRPFR